MHRKRILQAYGANDPGIIIKTILCRFQYFALQFRSGMVK